MSTYRSSVASFVPALIRSQALEGTEFLAEPGLQRHACGLLFADISGFTQLTEQLAQRGPAGAEELTALLNRYFGTIIDTLEASGGDVLKFAGDALLAVWPAQILALSMETTLARIVDVARVLQSTLHDYQVTPGVRLSMKLAIGAGEVDVEHLGGVFDRWEFLVSGKPLAHLGRANDAAEPGQIVLSAQAAQLLPTRMVDLTRLPGDLFLFDDASRSPELVDAQRVEEPLDGKQTERLLSFLPAAIRQRVAAGYADWLSELRQVSVVFMNLPGYGVDTSLESAQAAMRAMQVALYRYEGSINKLSVDDKGVSLIAVLGLPPLSHTDDPERALRASLDMREGLAELGLHCSTGVCTGIAFCGVVGNDRRREYTVMGDTVNLSARLMQAADGGVLCDSPTRRAVGGRMNFAARNPLRVKGKAAPVEVFVPTHSAGSVSVEAPRFLQGRARERRWLDALLNEALAGDAGVRLQRVCVSADGGLGKWSLVAEMLSRAERERAEVLVVVGDPLDTLTPFRAWRGVFLSLLGLADEGKAERATEASILERLPNAHARNFAPLLGDVVPVPLEDNQYTQALRGEDRREHALKLLTDLVCRHAELGPTVLAVKDGHLVDASSWDLLNRVDEDAPGLLIVVTVRPGSAPASEAARGWLAKSYTEHLELGELNDESLLALARQRLGVRTLAPALGDLLVQRCAGNPLYCEELTTALRDGGALEIDGDEAALSTDVSDASQVPASLHGLISSRIDRLSASAQMTLKIASVIGRVFAVQLVSSLHPGNPDPRDLADDLRHLVELELIARVPFGTRADLGRAPYYQFKNELVRDVAYGLMLYAQRRALHRSMGAWIEAHLADEVANHYATLGRHWALAAEGSEPDLVACQRAATYLERGADRAAASFANPEAVGLYREALALLRELAGGEPTSGELALLLKLGSPLVATRSFADPEVAVIYDRARAISRATGEHRAMFGAVRGLWQAAIGRSDYASGSELADELVALAAVVDDPGLELEAHRAVGNAVFWSGQFEKARKSMEYAVSVADVHPDAPLPQGFSQDPEIANRGILAWTLASMGHQRAAAEHIDAALDRGGALHHPFSMAYALGAAMWTYFIIRDETATEDFANQLVHISDEHGFPYFHIAGVTGRAWGRANTGSPVEALDELRDALADWRSSNGTIGMAMFLYVQAEIEALAGRPEQVLKTLLHPILQGRLKVEQWYRADVIRLRSEAQWQLGDLETATASMRSARRLATEQSARMASLRIACFEARELGGPQRWGALRAALDALPQASENGSVASAVELLKGR